MADIGQLKTQLNELVKQYIVYDAYQRPEYVYTCRADTEDGGVCSVVRYAYDSGPSGTDITNRVTYMKEYLGQWQESWEAF